MKSILLSIILLVLGTSVFLFSQNIYAEESPPPSPLVMAIQNNPYYFSEDNFGLETLRFFNAPLTPYLTPGVTEKSTDAKIMDAYYKANAHITSEIIEQDVDRAISYVVHVRSPEIFDDVISFNFQMFSPETNPNEFTLQSISSKDKQSYYELASRYINPGHRPDPSDVTIDMVSGDGTILQKWSYYDCEITYFETYLQNNLTYLMFTKSIQSEIRDYSEFNCETRYMQADMQELFNPYIKYRGAAETDVYPTEKLAKIPSPEDRAMSYLVSFSGGEIPKEITSQTFSQFGPLGETVPEYYPYLGSLTLDPQFFLESLVSKDKQGYYDLISRYIDAGKTPEPFDVNIDLVTGDGTPILRWQYFDCTVTSFDTYFQDSLLIANFHHGSDTEIRDHTEFECGGFHLEADFEALYNPYGKGPEETDLKNISSEMGLVIPEDSDRATSYVVHFTNGDFDTAKTIRTFAKFEQSEITEFNLQSLPSQDKNEIYDKIISHSLNPGRKPFPFDVTVDLVAGDNTIMQKWQYYQCHITNYQIELNDNALNARFAPKLGSEIREKTSFECRSQDLVTDPLKPFSLYTSVDVASPTLNPSSEPGGIAPEDDSRAISYVVRLSGGDFTQEETFLSFAKFETHGTTVSTANDALVYNKEKPAFALGSLPSKDKENFYLLLSEYLNSGKAPEPFDVAVDIVSGNNTILQTWQYFDCQMVNYEAFLEDTLVTLKYNPSPATEIRDTTGFVCDGFHFETPRLKAFSPYSNVESLSEEIELTNVASSIVPGNNDRPMSYVVSFSGGEAIFQHTYLTFSKYKQTETTEFYLESLPSLDKQSFYDFFIYRYINPGKTPELFDVSVDLVTGDGTTLQSWQYHECNLSDFVTYRNDNLVDMRYDPSSSSEIRERSSFDCAGVQIGLESKQASDPYSNFDVHAKVKQIIVSPHSQVRSGVPTHEVECKKEMNLMIRPSNSLSYCVDNQSLTTLQELGWKHIAKKQDLSSIAESADSTILQGILPIKADRATSYKINFVGSEIPEVINSITFSKFAPFTNDDIIVPTAQILGIPIPVTATISIDVAVIPVGNTTKTITVHPALDDLPLPIPTATIPGDTSTLFGVIPHYEIGESKPSFYLESLPAKDKKGFYKWIGRYINPGKTPELIDVGIEVLDGNGNLLQLWDYRDCYVKSYQVFLEDNILMIKYHERWQSEIKDRVMFACSGLHINEL
jgi:hypothetical protein